MDNEYLFKVEMISNHLSFQERGIERQIFIGGEFEGLLFSYQGLSPKPLWLNLVVTTNVKSETDCCFFDAEDDAESYCVRIIHRVDDDYIDLLERKIESGGLELKSLFVVLGEMKRADYLTAAEVQKKVDSGRLIPSDEITYGVIAESDDKVRCVRIHLNNGDSLPMRIEFELDRIDYNFTAHRLDALKV